MEIDSAKPFLQIANDEILPTLDYLSGLWCIVLDCGEWSVGGARPATQPGRHYSVRVAKQNQTDPFPYGTMITLKHAGEMQVKSVENDGAFWHYMCTASAYRGGKR